MRPAGPNVYAVSRAIWDDPDFAEEPFTEREAWMWLLGAAAWKDVRARGNAGAVDLVRSEFSFSLRFLAEKWRWSKDKVDRFLKRLQRRDMIRDTSRDNSQIYSIKNYNRFQVVGIPKRDSNSDSGRDAIETAPRQRRDKEETGKQDNRETSSLRSDTPSQKPVPLIPKGSDPDGFADFYAAYPRKTARPAAVKAFAKAVKRSSVAVLVEGARRYARERAHEDPSFTKHPATWLNNDCWLDEPAPMKTIGGRNGGHPKSAQQSAVTSISEAFSERNPDRFGDDVQRGAEVGRIAGPVDQDRTDQAPSLFGSPAADAA